MTAALTGGPIGLDAAFLMVEINLFGTPVDSEGGSSAGIKPSLATSRDISLGSLTYTFRLREDVVFRNGEKMTARDVKYTCERVMAEPCTYCYAETTEKAETDGGSDFVCKPVSTGPYKPEGG